MRLLKKGLLICLCLIRFESHGQNPVFIPSEYYLPLCNPIINQDSQASFRSGLSSDINSFYLDNVYFPITNLGIHTELAYAPFDVKTNTLLGTEYTTHQNTFNLRFGLSYSNLARKGIWSLDGGAFITWANRNDSFSGVMFPPQKVQSLHFGALVQNSINLTHSTLAISAQLSSVSIVNYTTAPPSNYAEIEPALYIEPSFHYIYHLQKLPVLSLFFQTHVSYSLQPFEQRIDGAVLSTNTAGIRVRGGFFLNL
ncbi:hypothetical protein GYB22_11400 [bacterium]|nr:hypothetical protein [bacterium]